MDHCFRSREGRDGMFYGEVSSDTNEGRGTIFCCIRECVSVCKNVVNTRSGKVMTEEGNFYGQGGRW